jgi:cell wall-associated NlpC family hydrolase
VSGGEPSEIGRRLGLSRWPISPRSLAGAVLSATLVVLGVVLVLALGGSGHAAAGSHANAALAGAAGVGDTAGMKAIGHGTDGRAAHSQGATDAAAARRHAHVAGAKSDGGVGTATAAGNGQGAAATAAETPDPEEAKSFPAPASVHHSLATKPSTAAEEVVAPGAPSNSEVRAELEQMHAVERAARKQEAKTMSIVPGGDSIGGNGQLPIPQGVPEVIQRVIAGANAITDFPYVFGGGHASFVSNSYDCSGSVSYALAAGGLLSAPETSGSLESWGAAGPGKWITVYANAGHVYMYVNIGGRWMRYDTVGRSGVFASRWQPDIRSNAGFVARHWPGL